MVNSSVPHHRKNGVFYTPSLLAETLVEPLITSPIEKILDPAYGDGALILAAEQVIKRKFNSRRRNNLFGCDISPKEERTQHLLADNLIRCDFFDYPVTKKYDVILMNPPYVRHHYLSKDKVDHYQNVIHDIFALKRTSDLWAYFIVNATSHLKESGSVGAILPWSFLQAEYASQLRKWLTERFSEIKILVLGSTLFDNAQERVVLLWMKGYGNSSQRLLIGSANTPDDYVRYHILSHEHFTREHINMSFSNDAHEIIETYKSKYGFVDFGSYADIMIGVVTGADKFFIKDDVEIDEVGIGTRNTIPILTNSTQLSGFSINGNHPNKRLLLITNKNASKLADFIKLGEDHEFHLRAHSQRRDPWYQVKVGSTPDAFFPYRVSLIPYLVLNNRDVQCTNSIHRIYFKNASLIQRKWMQLSLLSIPGQLSLEANSRVYGSGVLKIEPNALKNAICLASRDRSIDNIYKRVSHLLAHDKSAAMRAATEFINDSLGIDKKLSVSSRQAYEELVASRTNKKHT